MATYNKSNECLWVCHSASLSLADTTRMHSMRMHEICLSSSHFVMSSESGDMIGHGTLLLQKKQHKIISSSAVGICFSLKFGKVDSKFLSPQAMSTQILFTISSPGISST